MAETSARGRFVWHDLNTVDIQGAVKFYTSVVGWGTMPFADDPSYLMWTAGGAPIGGAMALAEQAKSMGAAPHWLSYVAVPDLDATVRLASDLGSRTYVPPAAVPNVGRYAVLADPQGAVFGLFQGAGEWPGHEGAPGLGEFSWHELITTDWRAALKFYQALFGWDAMDAMDMGAMGTYQLYGRNGLQLGGMYNKPSDYPAPPNWLPYAFVKDADKAAAAAAKRGGKIMAGPMDVPGGGRIAIGMDPQGAAFAVHSAAAVPAAQPAKSTTPVAKTSPKKAATRRSTKKAAARRAPGKSPARPAAKKAAPRSAPKRKAARKAAAKPARGRAATSSRRPAARKSPTRRRRASTARTSARKRARPARRATGRSLRGRAPAGRRAARKK